MDCFIYLIEQLLKKIIMKEEFYICIKIDITDYISIQSIFVHSFNRTLKEKDILGKKTFLIRKCYLKSYDANILQ